MRALNKGWIGIALIILFGASLFFFRGSSRYSNLFNSDNFVANVSGTQISTTQFMRSLEMNIGQFAQMIGEELTGDQIRAFQIHQLVIQNLINNAIFENEFDRNNFILDDSLVAAETKKRFPNLYVNNKINDDALNNFLRQQRLKIQDLVNIINYETRSTVFDDLFFEKNYPTDLTKKISMINDQARIVDILKIPYENVTLPEFNQNNISKDNLELKKYFEDNNDKYMTQEKRDISYIVIEKSFYKNDFTPDEDEILNYFANNKKFFTTPEKRSFIQFNFKSKEEAEDFKIKVSSLSMDEITNYAENKNIKYNEFKDVDKNQVLDELSSAIFSLTTGQISDVITTTLAHHIIILNKIEFEKEPSIDDVSEIIKNTLTEIQLDNFFNDLKLKINQQIIDGFSLSELATKNNLTIKNFADVSLNNEESSDLENFILKSAFSQNKDFISDIYDYDEKISFILNIDNIYPPKTKDLDKIFNLVLEDFIKSNKIKYANDLFEINKNDVNLDNLSSMFNLNTIELNIKSSSNELPSSLIKSVFDSSLEDILFSYDEKNIYYAKTKNIIIPENLMSSNEINLLAEFKNAFGNQIIKNKDISFNDELINGLLSQYK